MAAPGLNSVMIMSFTSDDFLNETWQEYWKWSYFPVFVDFFDERTGERDVYAVENVRYANGIELIIRERDELLKDISYSQKLPSLVNVGNLIGICRNYRTDGRVGEICYRIGMTGELEKRIDGFEKVNTSSNSAEWHFIVLK